jgi:thioredoxin reductase (NADPH)
MFDSRRENARIFGRNKDADCHEVRAFLSANRIPYEWVDRDRHPERVPPGVSEDPDCPAVVVDGQFFAEPPSGMNSSPGEAPPTSG